jgi:hypothetical protein
MPETSDVRVAVGGDRGVQATAGRLRRGIPIYASPVTQPRFRRATDVLSTFYLPPRWGFFAMRWLQRNRYL